MFARLEKEGKFRGWTLDLGCGCGENAIYLAKKGYPVVGIDFAENAIKDAKRRLMMAKATNPKKFVKYIDFFVGDVLKLDEIFDKNEVPSKFDVFLDSAVIHCIGDDEKKLQYLSGLLNFARHDAEYKKCKFFGCQPMQFIF